MTSRNDIRPPRPDPPDINIMDVDAINHEKEAKSNTRISFSKVLTTPYPQASPIELIPTTELDAMVPQQLRKPTQPSGYVYQSCRLNTMVIRS
ncbi:hypothetical protein RDI58_006986 [Solanum bulbocastanum]|uniref:Uncharacterized protein n=1 Tax=Solanum bulbocastanum TaxID=147425 RepID=A0AAN8TRZ2_SOLBU